MSVFRGSISEYPGVIVDHFIPANCEKGRIFFLSHCHRDHMTGLSSPNILTALRKLCTHLFCSEVTQLLLLKDPEFTHLAPYLRGLPMEEPIAMTLETFNLHEKLTFTVTLLPAGHCPGSSMFFFQGSRGNVLYTGDFRLTLEETRRLRSLHCNGSLLAVSTLYLDTTFFHPIATEIPSRDTSRDIILKQIGSWLAKSPNNAVHLQCTMFGYEHLYMGVYKKFNTKVHIAPWRMNAYREISAVTDCLTTDGESTQIHACTYRKGQKGPPLPCGSCQTKDGPPNVLRIKPSTQWFLFNKSTTHPCVFLPQFNKFRVIHSMHASYSELRDFIAYIKPKRIVPCVVPSGDTSLGDVCIRLKELLPQTEVSTTTYSDPKLASQRQGKVSRPNKTSAAEITETTESNDGWSTGDESIEEFTSTDDQVSVEEKPVFCHTQNHDVHISLPSLITVEDNKASPPPSSDSITLGSLVQSPIDLSLGTPSLESTSQVSCTLKDAYTTVSATVTDRVITRLLTTSQESSNSSSTTSLDQTITKSPPLSKCTSDWLEKDTKGDLSCIQGESTTSREGNNDWCLKCECSDDSITCTPLSKRSRLSEDTSNPMPRRLFECGVLTDPRQEQEAHHSTHSPSSIIDLTQDEQSSEQQADSSRDLPRIIDLTHDHQTHHCHDTDKRSPTVAWNTLCTATSTHSLHNTQRKTPPVVVDLVDSQDNRSAGESATRQRSTSVESSGHDSFGSPNCLPPTPGRENIHSILQRPDFP